MQALSQLSYGPVCSSEGWPWVGLFAADRGSRRILAATLHGKESGNSVGRSPGVTDSPPGFSAPDGVLNES